MSQSTAVSQTGMLRLARYHCFLEELLQSAPTGSITSREISSQLGVTEESVRSDLSHVDFKGRPGAGYDVEALHAALTMFLGLSAPSPFIVVGSLTMLEALPLVFPAAEFGMRPVAYFSQRSQDAGRVVGGLTVGSLADIPALQTDADNLVALVACDPDHVDETLQALSAANIRGVLMLTPRIRVTHPEGMHVTYFRIPCALKSLAGSVHLADTPAIMAGACCCVPPAKAAD